MTTLASAPPLGSPRLAPALGVFTELWRRQPVLAAMACIFLLAMLPTSFAMHLDARTVNGISVWVKPTKFLLSLAVYYATIAWFFACLPRAAQATRAGRFVVWSGVIVGVVIGVIAYAAVKVVLRFVRPVYVRCE